MDTYTKILFLLSFLIIIFIGFLKNPSIFPENGPEIDDRTIILKYYENFQKDGANWRRDTTPHPTINTNYLERLNSYNYSTVTADCNSSHNVDKKKLSAIKYNHERCEVVMLVRFWHQPDILWFNYENAMKICDEENGARDVQIFPFESNSGDEVNDMKYWVAMPKCKIGSNILLKIGKNTDKSPEESLKTYIPDLQIIYIEKSPENFEETLTNIKGSNSSIIIDMLWISYDSNLEFLKLLMNLTIEKMNVVVCQMNMEVAKENAIIFEKFLHSSYARANYIGLRPSSPRNSTLRSGYFQNIKDDRCILKFLK